MKQFYQLLTLVTLSLMTSAKAMAQEAYAVYTDDGTLTFYYDNQKSTREGTAYELNTSYVSPGWYTDHAADIKKAVFTPSFADARPTSTLRWFMGAFDNNEYKYVSSLSEIEGIEYLNTSNVTDMGSMFNGCSGLTTIYCGDNWNTDKVTDSNNMFYNCTNLVGGKGTVYDDAHVDVSYAHDDEGESNPGYLTYKDKDVVVILDPFDNGEEHTIGDEIDEDTDLDGTVIDNVYYSIAPEDGGYDADEKCVVLNREMTEEEMDEVVTFLLGEDEMKQKFSGIVFEVPAGKGQVSVTMMAKGNSILKVKFGSQKPLEFSLSNAKMTARFPYELTETTYVYVFAGAGAHAVGAKPYRAPAAENCLKIYSVSNTVDETSVLTVVDGISEPENGEVIRYGLDGTPLSGKRRSVNLVRMKDGSMKKVIVK
ncbi:MAG: BspA family leucine-rich repeat surface protein [Prevotella sp.]|nr:BspA family leucine-rich repeat surface protein [Prevotella sp.]